MRAFFRVATALAKLVAVAAAAWGVWHFEANRRLGNVLENARRNGVPTSPAEIQALPEIPPEQNAAPVYRRVFVALSGIRRDVFPSLPKASRGAEPDRLALGALEEYRWALAELRRAREIGRCRFEHDMWAGFLFGALRAEELLRLAAREEARAGRYEMAQLFLADGIAVAEAPAEDHSIFSLTVRVRLLREAAQTLPEVVRGSLPVSADLKSWFSRVDPEVLREEFRSCLYAARAETTQWILESPQQVVAQLAAWRSESKRPIWSWVPWLVLPDYYIWLAGLWERYDEVIARTEQPYYRLATGDAATGEKARDPPGMFVGGALVTVEGLETMRRLVAICGSWVAAAQEALRALDERSRTSSWPQRGESDAIDPLTGEPFRLAVMEGELWIYNVEAEKDLGKALGFSSFSDSTAGMVVLVLRPAESPAPTRGEPSRDDSPPSREQADRLASARRFDVAFALYEHALAAGADDWGTWNSYAWWLAIHTWPSETEPAAPAPGERSRRAVECARRGLELTATPGDRAVLLDTLAAALWANGQLDEALHTQEEAMAGAADWWRERGAARLEAYRRQLDAGVSESQSDTRSPEESLAPEAIDPAPLVDGVSAIWTAGGVPGPLVPLVESAVPVVAADDDATPPGSIVALAVGHGRGCVVALGHDNFFGDESLGSFDNRRFAQNVVDWLDGVSGRRKMLISRAHQEWAGGENHETIVEELQARGYTVVRSDGPLSRELLADVSVVFLGNAWGPVAPPEVEALVDFVSGGGGLLLLGLGWSWAGYRGSLDEYPMNVVGRPFGVRWGDGAIHHPTNQHEGVPVFRALYPDVGIVNVERAIEFLETTTAAHATDLGPALEADRARRAAYFRALDLLAARTQTLSADDPGRGEIYEFYRSLVGAYPHYFRKGPLHPPDTSSALAWARERLHRSMADALPLTEERKEEIATALGLEGRYLDIWRRFSILLLDNSALGASQLDLVYTLLDLLPEGLHNLRAISVRDFLGETSPEPGLHGEGGGVNIFGFRIGLAAENSFPGDVAPGLVDVFGAVVAHEVNHVVDAYYVANRDALRTQRDALIARAGSDQQNYLRSMIEEGYFARAPQEFFASIANQWFTDSGKTVLLGLARFDAGRLEPLRQALFFADVYSLGGDRTWFYEMNTRGQMTRQEVPLTRDHDGRIVSLEFGGRTYLFAYDEDGLVSGYEVAP